MLDTDGRMLAPEALRSIFLEDQIGILLQSLERMKTFQRDIKTDSDFVMYSNGQEDFTFKRGLVQKFHEETRAITNATEKYSQFIVIVLFCWFRSVIKERVLQLQAMHALLSRNINIGDTNPTNSMSGHCNIFDKKMQRCAYVLCV